MTRHKYDMKVLDFTWKQNRLSKDKEALKNSVLNVINRKRPAKKDEDVSYKLCFNIRRAVVFVRGRGILKMALNVL